MKTNRILLTAIIIFSIRSIIAQNLIVQNIISDVRIDSLTKFVNELSGQTQVSINGNPDTIHSRHKDSPGNEKAFQYVKQKFLSYGLQIDSLQFSAAGKNIWSVLTGTLHPNQKYIIGAHYDNMPPYPNYINAPGADDNASGTAAVIEAARIFRQYSFPYTIICALWDEEEQGLIGSNVWAANAGSNNDSILAYINLDMIGWDGNNDSIADIHTKNIAQSVPLANISKQCNTVYDLGLDSIHIINPGITASDHASFWNNNYTAIAIAEQYYNDFNPFYHTPADSLGQFNIPFYEKVAKLAYATLGTLAIDTNQILGIEQGDLSGEINIYPNPASDRIFINFSGKISGIYFYNMNGICTTDYNQTKSIDIKDLSSGVYFIQIITESGVFNNKIIVIK